MTGKLNVWRFEQRESIGEFCKCRLSVWGSFAEVELMPFFHLNWRHRTNEKIRSDLKIKAKENHLAQLFVRRRKFDCWKVQYVFIVSSSRKRINRGFSRLALEKRNNRRIVFRWVDFPVKQKANSFVWMRFVFLSELISLTNVLFLWQFNWKDFCWIRSNKIDGDLLFIEEKRPKNDQRKKFSRPLKKIRCSNQFEIVAGQNDE